MKKDRRKLILEGNMYKVIWTLALPIMFNNFIQTVYNVTDTYFVSKLGGLEVAAISLVWPAIFLLISLNMGINTAGGAIISQYFGGGNYKKSRKLAGQLVWFVLVFSSFIGVIGYFSADWLVYTMGGRGRLLEEATSYFKIISLGTPLISYSMAFTSIRQGEGDTTSPMILSIISVTINIILDPIFIFVLGMGVRGAAIATLIARAILCIIATYQLFVKKHLMKMTLADIKPQRWMLNEIIKKGIPLSLGTATTAFGFIVLNTFIVSYGEGAMAAFGIGNRITSIIFMPAMGIGGAVSTIAGQNLGGGKHFRIREAFKKAIEIIAVISVVGTVFMWWNANNFVRVFVQDPKILEMGEYYLKTISLTIICMGTFQTVVGIFQGISQSKKAMTLSMIRLWGLRIPLVMLFTMVPSWEEKSVWYAMLASNYIGMAIALYMFRKTKIDTLEAVKV